MPKPDHIETCHDCARTLKRTQWTTREHKGHCHANPPTPRLCRSSPLYPPSYRYGLPCGPMIGADKWDDPAIVAIMNSRNEIAAAHAGDLDDLDD